jgi:hypothetical protein
MQPRVFLHALLLDKLDKPGESALGVHHPKDGIVPAVSAIVQQDGSDEVECGIVVFLKPISLIPYPNVYPISRTCRRQYIIWRRTYSLWVTNSSPCSRRKTHFAML